MSYSLKLIDSIKSLYVEWTSVIDRNSCQNCQPNSGEVGSNQVITTVHYSWFLQAKAQLIFWKVKGQSCRLYLLLAARAFLNKPSFLFLRNNASQSPRRLDTVRGFCFAVWYTKHTRNRFHPPLKLLDSSRMGLHPSSISWTFFQLGAQRLENKFSYFFPVAGLFCLALVGYCFSWTCPKLRHGRESLENFGPLPPLTVWGSAIPRYQMID
jgi:hypothetical protein